MSKNIIRVRIKDIFWEKLLKFLEDLFWTCKPYYIILAYGLKKKNDEIWQRFVPEKYVWALKKILMLLSTTKISHTCVANFSHKITCTCEDMLERCHIFVGYKDWVIWFRAKKKFSQQKLPTKILCSQKTRQAKQIAHTFIF